MSREPTGRRINPRPPDVPKKRPSGRAVEVVHTGAKGAAKAAEAREREASVFTAEELARELGLITTYQRDQLMAFCPPEPEEQLMFSGRKGRPTPHFTEAYRDRLAVALPQLRATGNFRAFPERKPRMPVDKVATTRVESDDPTTSLNDAERVQWHNRIIDARNAFLSVFQGVSREIYTRNQKDIENMQQEATEGLAVLKQTEERINIKDAEVFSTADLRLLEELCDFAGDLAAVFTGLQSS